MMNKASQLDSTVYFTQDVLCTINCTLHMYVEPYTYN